MLNLAQFYFNEHTKFSPNRSLNTLRKKLKQSRYKSIIDLLGSDLLPLLLQKQRFAMESCAQILELH